MDYLQTPCGKIRGSYDAKKQITCYRGIRYAKADRFCYPSQVTGWEGVYDAEQYGASAYQEWAFGELDLADEDVKKWPGLEIHLGVEHHYSEDCLFLNIWTPDGAKGLPVLFYIHGGGYKTGYSYDNMTDGFAFAQKDVILVTINYRLGPLGFLALPELADDEGHTGNYALADQITALKWIRDNIAAFGGNPEKITIMGQSAGAMCVQLLSVSPMAEGLFAGSIMISGGGASRKLPFSRSRESQYELGRQFGEKLGVKTREDWLNLEPKELYQAFGEFWPTLPDSGDFAVPMVDGYFLPVDERTAMETGAYHKIPYMVTSTSEDILPKLLHKMAVEWAQQVSGSGQNGYVSLFSRQLPGDDNGAWHTADLWYVFCTLDRSWRPFTTWDYELADSLCSYIANFVKTGDPNGEGLPQWEPCIPGKPMTMCFADAELVCKEAPVETP